MRRFGLRFLDAICLVTAAQLWIDHHPLGALMLLACYAWPWENRA